MKSSRLIIPIIVLSFLIRPLCSQVTITDFNSSRDMEAVVALIKAEWHKLFLLPTFDQNMINRMLYQKHPGDPNHYTKSLFIKVAYDDQKFIGFITYFYADLETGHIELIAIHPDFRGKGWSKKLIEYSMCECAKQGAHIVELYVYPSNPHAIDVYTHLGFTVKNRIMGCLLLARPIIT